MKEKNKPRIAIIGAGPAGLACAEVLAKDHAFEVTVFEQMPSAARKFLMAGKTGLNISHNEPFDDFIARYDQEDWLRGIIEKFDANAIQMWMQDLGISSYVGSSGRIFPNEMKAAPLLRAWLRQLQQNEVKFCYRHQVTELNGQMLSGIDLKTQQSFQQHFDAVVLACGALSWPQLGSDGKWQQWLDASQIARFQASNVGVLVKWSSYMTDYFGQPLKRIKAWSQREIPQFGEMVISHYGLEGGLVYRCNRGLRMRLESKPSTELYLDLLPDLSIEQLIMKLASSKKQSLNTIWQKAGLDKTKIALLRDVVPKADWTSSAKMAQHIKQLCILIQGFRPIEEAISCAGGVKHAALDKNLMIKGSANIFACGEMLDWDAPTGGYLLTACLATGRQVAYGVHQVLQD